MLRSPRLPYVLLLAIVALSFGLNARNAANPRSAYQSADERAYGMLAIDIAEEHRYGAGMQEPLHWPPAAPVLFAIGHKLFPGAGDASRYDIRAAYWEQALLTTGTTALAAILAWLLAGPWAGVIAGALVGTYPPLIAATGDQLSEPLGAFLLIGALTALAYAVKRRAGRARPWIWAAAGGLFALAILARTDLLPLPFLLAGAGAPIVVWRTRAWRRALLTWGALAVATVVVLAPWTIYASKKEGKPVPVTKGSAAALFVGTYLPGGGTTVGMKMALEPELRRRHPRLAGTKTYKIPAAFALELIAERHPGLSRNAALQKEARHNLVHYATTQPVEFARMAFGKAKRMWFFYYRGGGVHDVSSVTRTWQIFLVVAGTLGLLAGLWRRRDPILGAVLATVALSTAAHAIVVSQARYNLPLMPSLVAAGVAGWWLALRRPAQRTVNLPSDESSPLNTSTKAPPSPVRAG